MGNDTDDPTQTGQGQDWEPPPPAGANGAPVEAAPVVPPPTPPPQEKPHPAGRRRGATPTGVGAAKPPPGRPSGKAGAVPDRFDPQAPGAPKWTSREVEVLWPELLEWLEAKGRSAYDVVVNVIRIEPPPRQSIGYAFEASAVVGNQEMSPTTAIKQYVEDYYHNIARGPARYELQFVWKANGQYIVNGYISLQSQGEINALRQAQWQQRMASQYGVQPGFGAPPRLPAPPGVGAPPQQQSPQQPPPPPPPYGFQPYGYPGQYGFPPPQQSDLERRMAALEEENKRLRAGLAAPPPRPPPHQPGQTPITQLTVESLATAMVAAVKAAGLGAAPPASSTQLDPITAMDQGFKMLDRYIAFGEKVRERFGGGDEPEEVPQLPAPPEVKEEEDLPYQITELPSQWDDGSKAKLVRDKETGKVDLLGMALMNPRPAQKIMDAGAQWLEGMARRRGLAGPPEEEEQPQQPPQFQQPQVQQLQPPQQQPQQPSPPPNSNDQGGWGGF